jgi:hypothetical protein
MKKLFWNSIAAICIAFLAPISSAYELLMRQPPQPPAGSAVQNQQPQNVDGNQDGRKDGKDKKGSNPKLPDSCSAVMRASSDGPTISVGCPKVWQSARVFSVLDGMTRDLDSMTVQALELLDPNEINSVVIDLVQNALDVAVKYNQAQGVNNAFNLQKLKAERANNLTTFNNAQQNLHDLQNRRSELFTSITKIQKQEADLAAKNPPDPGDDQKKKNLADQEKTLQGQLDSVNSDIANAKDVAPIPDANLDASTLTSADLATKSNNNLGLNQLPQNFQDALTKQLAKPSFPPMIKMDNVIELLRQRIAREFSAMYDDLMRDPQKTIYLMEIDTTLQPNGRADDRIARIELSLAGSANPKWQAQAGQAAPDCTDLRVYDVYPAAAAYNTMEGFQKTTHVGLTGVAQTIIGLGLAASYQHDHSTLRSGLSQSNYISGFGSGQGTFGWDFAPAPYDKSVASGVRSTYAILLAPKGVDSACTIQLQAAAKWLPRAKHYPGWNPLSWWAGVKTTSQGSVKVELPKARSAADSADSLGPEVTEIAYVPFYATKQVNTEERSQGKPAAASTPTPTPTPNAAVPANQDGSPGSSLPPNTDDTVIQITLKDVADPNLVITANDKVLKRVRDVRGRGLYTTTEKPAKLAGNDVERKTLENSRFGLLEADALGPDTWYLADQNNLLIRVARSTAQTDHFPVIRLIDPAKGAAELIRLAQKSKNVRIGEWTFSQPGDLPASAFQPLYANPYGPGQIRAYIDEIKPPGATHIGDVTAISIRLVSFQKTPEGKPIYLHDQAQIVMEVDVPDPANKLTHWALNCRQEKGQLVCTLPLKHIKELCVNDLSCASFYKIYVDQTPYYDRPGIWGDADVDSINRANGLGTAEIKPPDPDLIPEPTYKIHTELRNGDPLKPQWVATLGVKNLDVKNPMTGKSACLDEFRFLLPKARIIKAQTSNQLQPHFDQGEFCEPNLAQPNVEPPKDPNPKKQASCSSSPFNLSFADGKLTFRIPYKYFWLLPDSFHLLPNCLDGDTPVDLPHLREQLMPAELMLMKSGNEMWRIQGRNLGAVNQVYLAGGKPDATVDASSSDTAIEFSAKNLSGTYKVYLGIQNYFVPARVLQGGVLQQMTLTAPEPPVANAATGPSPK